MQDIVTNTEIQKNEYNLNIPRYIDSSEAEDLHDLNAHLNGGIPDSDIENLNSYWEVLGNVKNELFVKSDRDGYSNIKVASDKIKETILNSDEFKKFKDEAIENYMSWKSRHDETLYALDVGVSGKALIHTLAEDLLECFDGVKLIEKYDIYQILRDYWSEVLQDDIYLISVDGWSVGKMTRELVPTKDKKGKNVYREAHDFEINKKRYKADLIPPSLIVASYFQNEQDKINKLQNKAEVKAGELETFIEENTSEDGLLEDARNEKENINKASVTKRLKETEDADEIVVLKKCKKLFEEDAKAKKVLKEAQIKLDLEVFKKYPTLSIDEIKELVIEHKWHDYLLGAITEEIERVTQSLANRVKILEERYSKPLSKINDDVNKYEKKVEEHLKAMGLSW